MGTYTEQLPLEKLVHLCRNNRCEEAKRLLGSQRPTSAKANGVNNISTPTSQPQQSLLPNLTPALYHFLPPTFPLWIKSPPHKRSSKFVLFCPIFTSCPIIAIIHCQCPSCQESRPRTKLLHKGFADRLWAQLLASQ